MKLSGVGTSLSSAAPTTQAFGDAAAAGAGGSAARNDHRHGMPADPRGATLRRAVAQSVNNSIALVNDDTFVFAIAANEVLEGTLMLDLATPANAGFKYAFDVPVGAIVDWGFIGPETATMIYPTSLVTGDDVSGAITGGWTLGVTCIHWRVANGANAGNVQGRFAQDTAVVGNTTIGVGSFATARRASA